MTYKYVENQVLKLLNQYTIAGTGVADTYNNQKDYLLRIPSLVNDAMMEIATTVRKIQVVTPLCDLECIRCDDQECWFVMPDDFFMLKSGDTVRTHAGRTVHVQVVSQLGQNILIVPKGPAQDRCDMIIVVYFRYPELLDEDRANVDPDTELDNTPDTHLAIPYYVAGVLAMHDDPFLCSTLMNGYEDKLAKMMPPVTADVHPVQDAYATNWTHNIY